jgi:hypothetical protein
MRSSRSGRSKGQDPPLFPTAWSEWEWSDQFKCYQRYRLKGPEDYEWDYGQVQSSALPRTQPSPSLSDDFGSLEISDDQYTTSPNADTTSPVVLDQRNVFCTWPLCSQSFNTVNERDRHFRTIHSNNGDRPYRCVVDGCPAGVTSWTTAVKLRVHNKTWHGPYACSVPTCPRRAPNGFATQADLDIHTRDEHGKSPPSGFSGMEATVGIDTDATPLSSKVFSEYSAIASEDIKPKFTNNIRPHTPTNYITSRDFSTDRESFDPRKNSRFDIS